jgi:hypothetical protein
MATEKDKVSTAAPLEPVTVAVIGTGNVTGGPAPITTGTEAVTPATHQPNLRIQVVPPLLAIAVRFGNAYLTILVGLVAAGMTSDVIPYTDFLDLVLRCAGLSVAGAGLGALKDLVTIFGRLETKFPLLTGNV